MAKSDYDLKVGEVQKEASKMLRQLPLRVSNIAANDFKRNFERQGILTSGVGVIKWKKRAKSKNTKDESRAILVKSGRLRRGIMPEPTGNVARVVNRVPYAVAHNEGSKEKISIKSHYRVKRRKMKTTEGKTKKVGLVEKVSAHSRKQNLPKRAFMVTTRPLMDEIDKYVNDQLSKLI